MEHERGNIAEIRRLQERIHQLENQNETFRNNARYVNNKCKILDKEKKEKFKMETKASCNDDTDENLSKAQKTLTCLEKEKGKITESLERKELESKELKTRMESIREMVLPENIHAGADPGGPRPPRPPKMRPQHKILQN